MAGRKYSDENYRYGFNGKENDKDFGNQHLIQDYGFRLYNPEIGKFLSVDPLFKSYPWDSTYAFAENDVISSIDLEGLEKYKVVGRSFAPRGSFELTHFEGKADDRTKFEIADYKKVLARIHVKLLIDLDEWLVGKAISSQPTILKGGLFGEWEIDNQSINISDITGSKENKLIQVKGDYYAKNGTELGPGIDIQFNLKFDVDEDILHISSKITGNVFPAQETMVFDAVGNGIFIGTSLAEGSPLTNVWGSGEENILSNYSLKVALDNEGNFKGIYSPNGQNKNELISIDEWNKSFENQKVWDGQDNRDDYED
ncbi:RHS repeat-associated core domain-containing protein [Rapidithrix thailandica]|uniref:RHS repeat-associated core domain-containing protein n=1 Tax=Rapidithrix thailandica TaxID=413964 RepID=A0AAW9SK87_9BACT